MTKVVSLTASRPTSAKRNIWIKANSLCKLSTDTVCGELVTFFGGTQSDIGHYQYRRGKNWKGYGGKLRSAMCVYMSEPWFGSAAASLVESAEVELEVAQGVLTNNKNTNTAKWDILAVGVGVVVGVLIIVVVVVAIVRVRRVPSESPPQPLQGQDSTEL
eukprot:TRINITY_DN67820_c1_g1_i1.p2 TRINITY_DN67820_c1_g1~~TRINITY_DN67820_c1_g1_i1.p2  ORF type:complete len:160 (+),score=14.98 TRINITY_DN67820_c1_g1_i1:311-790(+)